MSLRSLFSRTQTSEADCAELKNWLNGWSQRYGVVEEIERQIVELQQRAPASPTEMLIYIKETLRPFWLLASTRLKEASEVERASNPPRLALKLHATSLDMLNTQAMVYQALGEDRSMDVSEGVKANRRLVPSAIKEANRLLAQCHLEIA